MRRGQHFGQTWSTTFRGTDVSSVLSKLLLIRVSGGCEVPKGVLVSVLYEGIVSALSRGAVGNAGSRPCLCGLWPPGGREGKERGREGDARKANTRPSRPSRPSGISGDAWRFRRCLPPRSPIPDPRSRRLRQGKWQGGSARRRKLGPLATSPCPSHPLPSRTSPLTPHRSPSLLSFRRNNNVRVTDMSFFSVMRSEPH